MAKKLYKLKKWLTIEETAKMLSVELEEEINASDILQLAIDGTLRISVIFPHDWEGRICDITEDTQKAIQSCREIIGLNGEIISFCEYEKVSDTEFIKIDTKEHWFEAGIYELKLIGNSKLDVEFKMKLEAKIPITEVFSLSGFYVYLKNGVLVERQTRIYSDYCDIQSKRQHSYTYPCAGIAEIDGAFFVIQTEHLNEFVSILDNDKPQKLNLEFSLRLIAEMLRATKSKAKKWTQGELINEILEQRQNNNEQISGLEQRMIEEYFLQANKQLKAN